jgi:Mg-chelatase subunit ChlD
MSVSSATLTLARLGLVLTGTNEDLELLPRESKGSGAGESDDSEDTEESEEEGSGSGASDDDAEGEESEDTDSLGADLDDAEGDESEEGEGSGASDSSEEGDGESGEDEGSDDGDGESGDDGAEGDSAGEDGEGSSEGSDASGDAEGDSEGEDTSDDGDASDEPADASGEADGDGGDDSHEGASEGGMTPAEAKTLAQELIDALENGDETGLLDNNAALGEAIDAKVEEGNEDCLEGEEIWRPYDTGRDIVEVVTEGTSVNSARKLRNKVKKEISYLRSQLRNKFLQARTPRVVHGVRKGRDLSDRRLVNSVVELRSGRRPTRPDWDRHAGQDCSLAAAVVLDQSSSMGRKLATQAAAAALAIATPLDELGAPCLVIGPRSGGVRTFGRDLDAGADADRRNLDREKYHRKNGVTIDIFKDWEEPMRRALPRFAAVQSTGGTPLSDGIQYAMQYINERPERHRVILVVTDGHPDRRDVVKRQIRLAREAGVHVVGVGISSGCYAVTGLFPTHVAVHNLPELPREMLSLLTGIMFPKRGGKKIALDGKF